MGYINSRPLGFAARPAKPVGGRTCGRCAGAILPGVSTCHVASCSAPQQGVGGRHTEGFVPSLGLSKGGKIWATTQLPLRNARDFRRVAEHTGRQQCDHRPVLFRCHWRCTPKFFKSGQNRTLSLNRSLRLQPSQALTMPVPYIRMICTCHATGH